MSIRVMTLVWDHYPGGGTELLSLLALADWSDDEGRCWPSLASIAKKIRLSEKQTRRLVHLLIESGYIAVTENSQGGATSRRYQIALSRFATPPADGRGNDGETPPADVPYPSRGWEGTPPADGSRTVIDTSSHVSDVAQARRPRVGKQKSKREEVTFGIWYENIIQAGEKPISDYRPLLNYVDRSGLPKEFVDLAWLEFKRRYLPGGSNDGKRYRDWRSVFLKAIEGGWLHLWGHNGTEYYLTAQGHQAQRVHSFREAA